MKKPLQYNTELVAAILAVIKDEATIEQETVLNEWLAHSASNRELYYAICDPENRAQAIDRLRGYNKVRAWRRILAKVAKRRRKAIFFRLGKVAAVLALIVSLGTTTYLLVDRQKTENYSQGALIMPGSSKAMLTFADGNSVMLDTVSVGNLGAALIENGHEIRFVDEQTPSDKPAIAQASVRYNTIIVPRGGEYKITLTDGSVVYLNSQTTLRFPENFNHSTREVFLEGEGYFDVAKDEQKPFVVRCGGFDVRAVGTTFNISNYVDDEFQRATVTSGRVRVSVEGFEREIGLGEQAVVKDVTSQFEVVEVDVENYISWINSNLRFESMKICEIMQRLSRWYDIEVVYADSAKRNIHFSGYLPRYTNIAEVLNLLGLASNISFEVDGRVVTVK